MIKELLQCLRRIPRSKSQKNVSIIIVSTETAKFKELTILREPYTGITFSAEGEADFTNFYHETELLLQHLDELLN